MSNKGSRRNSEEASFFGYSQDRISIVPIFFLFFCQIILFLSWLIDFNFTNNIENYSGIVFFLVSLFLCYLMFAVFSKFDLER
tara:strand:- start:171 stop:419 length:249 start_codon:yes stop_codon:yes gene_type:complete